MQSEVNKYLRATQLSRGCTLLLLRMRIYLLGAVYYAEYSSLYIEAHLMSRGEINPACSSLWTAAWLTTS